MRKPKTKEVLVSSAAIVAAAALAGKAVVGHDKSGSQPVKPKRTPAPLTDADKMRLGRQKLEKLAQKDPNVVKAETDIEFPRYESVTYHFTPGHNNIGSVAETLGKMGEPDVIRKIESYNHDSEIVKYGSENDLTIDVDPSTGDIVANPNTSPPPKGTGE